MAVSKEAWARRWRRLLSPATRRHGEADRQAQRELVPTICFGLLGEPEQLSLEGLVADHRASVPEAPYAAGDDDPRT